jgi:hypothetical protein
MNQDILKNFTFLAFLTPIMLFFQQSRSILLKIFRIFWKERTIPYDFAPKFYKLLYDNSIVLNFDDYDLSEYSLYSVKYDYCLPIIFKQYKFEIFLYKRFIPLFLYGAEQSGLKIQYLKFTFNFEKFFTEITNKVHEHIKQEVKNKQEVEDRFYIQEIRAKSLKSRLYEGKDSNSGSPSNSGVVTNQKNYTITPFDSFKNKFGQIIGFKEDEFYWQNPTNKPKSSYQFTEQGLYILGQVEKWLKAEKFYQERNIPYRRSCLLYSVPGIGKSRLVLEISKKLKIPLIILDLNSGFDNEEFCNSIDNLTTYPAIILIEDFDTIFNGRESLNKSTQYQSLTFDCILNRISGAKSIKNKFIFITTNHIEKLDDAILRSGRCDYKIELQSLSYDEKFKMANIVLDNNKELVEKVMNRGSAMSTADFENLVTRISLENYWN